MISLTIDTRPAREKLRRWRAALHERLSRSFAESAGVLLVVVRAKLSGTVLRPKSGALRASLRADVTETATGFATRVWSDGSVPYARIHEYGGRIATPEIRPMRARALAFVYGGRMVFAKRTRAHVVEIPGRSYMRSSLVEFAPMFLDDIRRVALDGFR